jgi:hypothetical protein
MTAPRKVCSARQLVASTVGESRCRWVRKVSTTASVLRRSSTASSPASRWPRLRRGRATSGRWRAGRGRPGPAATGSRPAAGGRRADNRSATRACGTNAHNHHNAASTRHPVSIGDNQGTGLQPCRRRRLGGCAPQRSLSRTNCSTVNQPLGPGVRSVRSRTRPVMPAGQAGFAILSSPRHGRTS